MFVLVALAAIGLGLAVSGSVKAGLVDALCAGERCPTVGLTGAGWASLGVPLLVAGVLYRHARPSRTNLHALVLCVVVAAFGVAVVFGPEEARMAGPPHPHDRLLGVGMAAALFPVLAVGAFRRELAGDGRRTRRPGRGRPGPQRRPRPGPDPGRPLLVVNIAQLIGLAGALIWVALAA